MLQSKANILITEKSQSRIYFSIFARSRHRSKNLRRQSLDSLQNGTKNIKNDLDYQIWYEINDFDNNRETSRVSNWINETNDAIQTLINMHQFGYKVEEVEERYLVKMKGVEENKNYLCYNANGNWLFGKKYDLDRSRTHHTRRELESAGFGNVFDSPLFEVLEVEE